MISLIDATDCAQQTNTSAVDKTEILFQCDKDSGKFVAFCTQDSDSNCSPLPVSAGRGSSNNSETGNPKMVR